MSSTPPSLLVALLMVSQSVGCAGKGRGPGRTSEEERAHAVLLDALGSEPMEDVPAPVDVTAAPDGGGAAMTVEQAKRQIESRGSDIKAEANVLEFTVAGVRMAFIADEAADRMRLVAPVARVADLEPDQLAKLMDANFHTALDARYATSDGVVYAAYIHPLSPLTSEQLDAAMVQVANLVRTFGGSYSSTDMTFGG